MKYFKNSMTLDEVKSQYKIMAKKLHPDMGGSVEEMQILNDEFELAFKVADKFNKSENKESSSEFKRTFYTENGWEGSRYDSNLYNKDIAKIIRDYVKYVYPTYKFSITSTYNEISIHLMEYPVELTNVEKMKDYCKNHSHYWNIYINDKCYSESEMTDELWTMFAKEQVKKCSKYNQLNHYYLDRETWMNPIVINVLKDVLEFLNSYNFDDSDSMVDYFNTNFYIHLSIGKWNKEAKFVEKVARITPTKENKSAKRICA